MDQKLKVLIASRSAEALRVLNTSLAGAAGMTVTTRLISNGHTDPLHDARPVPDVLVLRFDTESLAELATLSQSSPDTRPPLLVVGPAGNPDAMRLAVRSGARDFLAEPLDVKEFVAAVERLRHEPRRSVPPAQKAELTLVLGAAGGVGTSFLACNLAHAFANAHTASAVLIDLDINAAPLAAFLDLKPERGLPAALAEVEYLDQHALAGYVTKHQSGLHLLGAPSKTTLFAKDMDANRFAALMAMIMERYRWAIVDGSHTLDDLSLTALGMARHVLVVVQQSVVQLRQAARLMRILFAEYGVPDDRITVVVNRYLKRSTVTLEDIQRTLAREDVTIVANHYRSVVSSVDGGMPIMDFEPSSPVARAIMNLQRQLDGTPRPQKSSLLRRALPLFSGNER
ncbi:MAG: AAA family ATPase [Steroidobacteraceae bacterium]